MKKLLCLACLVIWSSWSFGQTEKKPVIREGAGYWPLPDAAVQPAKSHTYRAIFDATRGAAAADALVPAVDDAVAFVNALAATGVPASHRKVAIVFHGAAVEGILNDAAYRRRHGRDNPNLPLLRALRKAGVELYVCGQLLHFKNIDPATLTPEVRVATDAVIVLVTYQNRGYALLTY